MSRSRYQTHMASVAGEGSKIDRRGPIRRLHRSEVRAFAPSRVAAIATIGTARPRTKPSSGRG